MNISFVLAENALPQRLQRGRVGAAGVGRTWPSLAASLVERREAPHPYVTGVRAPSQRRAAGRVMVRQGCLASTPAPPGAPFPSAAREKEKGKGRRLGPEDEV